MLKCCPDSKQSGRIIKTHALDVASVLSCESINFNLLTLKRISGKVWNGFDPTPDTDMIYTYTLLMLSEAIWRKYKSRLQLQIGCNRRSESERGDELDVGSGISPTSKS